MQFTRGDCASLRMSGSLTVRHAESMRQHLTDLLARGDSLTVDFRGVEHFSTASLQLLIAAHRQAREAGTRLVLENASQALEEAFREAGLSGWDAEAGESRDNDP
ncbi:MAG: STAS domain-containing protein [Desulfatibacillaceae bacterium]